MEEGWVVDTQGIADDAVDVDGWSYATDFGWLRIPPAPNAGKFRKVWHHLNSMKSFCCILRFGIFDYHMCATDSMWHAVLTLFDSACCMTLGSTQYHM